MNTNVVRLAVLAVAALLTRQVSAQTAKSVAPSRGWDAVGGVGIRFGDEQDTVVPRGDWDVEVRYWTEHFKTSIGLSTAGQETFSVSTHHRRGSTQRPGPARPDSLARSPINSSRTPSHIPILLAVSGSRRSQSPLKRVR
jgi:hypothetical protein